MAVYGAVPGRGGLRLLRQDAPVLLEPAEAAAPGAGHKAGGRPRLVPPPGPAGHDALCGCLRRKPGGREEKSEICQGVRGKLPAPDAPAPVPQGAQRRGLRRLRLPERPARAGHYGGPGVPGRRLPEGGDQPVPGLRHEPHQRGPPVGPEGTGRRAGLPGAVFLL